MHALEISDLASLEGGIFTLGPAGLVIFLVWALIWGKPDDR